MAKFMKLHEDEDKKTLPEQSQQASVGQIISLPQSPDESDAWEHYLEKGKTDGYTSQWQQQIDDLTKQILGRGQFQYDINADALFQQISDRYTQQGKLAMADAMGKAAALTGGHASSYGQSVGQQTYQAYLQGLYDKVPELQQMALDRHNAETDRIQQQLALLQDQEDRDYNKWLTERDYRDGKQEDAYNRLIDLIVNTGYEPTDEELAEAGLTPERAAAYAKLYSDQQSSGGGYYDDDEDSKDPTKDPAYTGGLTFNAIKALQKFIGAELTGVWDKKTQERAKAIYGTEYAMDIYNIYTKGKDLDGDGWDDNRFDYSGWTSSHWEQYFNSIRESEGSAAALEAYKEMLAKIPEAYRTAAHKAAQGPLTGH